MRPGWSSPLLKSHGGGETQAASTAVVSTVQSSIVSMKSDLADGLEKADDTRCHFPSARPFASFDKAVQTALTGQDIDNMKELLEARLDGIEGARMVDGQVCLDLCMAEPEIAGSKATKGVKPEYGKNGFRWLPNGLTSDSGAVDTVGPAAAYPEHPMEESPGSKRGLHYVAAGGLHCSWRGEDQ